MVLCDKDEIKHTSGNENLSTKVILKISYESTSELFISEMISYICWTNEILKWTRYVTNLCIAIDSDMKESVLPEPNFLLRGREMGKTQKPIKTFDTHSGKWMKTATHLTPNSVTQHTQFFFLVSTTHPE